MRLRAGYRYRKEVGGSASSSRHLADRLGPEASVVISRRTGVDTGDVDALARASEGCEIVAHCAGINREIGDQTYQRVHIKGTANVIEAAKRAGVRKVMMLSFLRARPDCGSLYHESKWRPGLDTRRFAALLDQRGERLGPHRPPLPHRADPAGARDRRLPREAHPAHPDDLTDILEAAIDGRMPRATVAVVGAEQLLLSKAVRRVASVLGRRVVVVPWPVWAQYALAQVTEWTMKVPLVANAQVRMLAEGVTGAAPAAASVPDDLRPRRMFTAEQIRSCTARARRVRMARPAHQRLTAGRTERS